MKTSKKLFDLLKRWSNFDISMAPCWDRINCGIYNAKEHWEEIFTIDNPSEKDIYILIDTIYEKHK